MNINDILKNAVSILCSVVLLSISGCSNPEPSTSDNISSKYESLISMIGCSDSQSIDFSIERSQESSQSSDPLNSYILSHETKESRGSSMDTVSSENSYKVFVIGKYSQFIYENLNSSECVVQRVTSDDLEKRDLFNRNNSDCLIISPDSALSDKATLNIKLFMKTLGDVVFLSKSGWETGNELLGLPLYFYYKTYQMWDLTGTKNILPSVGREGKYTTGNYEGTALSGWSALGYMYPGASEAYSLLDAYDKQGKFLGRVASILANYYGEYAGSEWGLFGIVSDAYYRSSPFVTSLRAMLKDMSDNVFFQDAVYVNKSRIQKTKTFQIKSQQPNSFVKIKDGVFIGPDNKKIFLVGTNYTAPILYMSGYGAGESVNIDAIEADFRKAAEAGINCFRIWSLTYQNPVACKAVKEFSRKYGIYLEIVLPSPAYYFDSRDYQYDLKKNAEYWKDETMVIGYDLENEPFITTVGGLMNDSDLSPAINFKAYSSSSASLLSSSEKGWCDTAVAQNYWPQCSSLISDAYKKELWGLKVIFDKAIKSKYWGNSDEQYSTYPWYTGGSLKVDSVYEPALDAVNDTFKMWIDGAVQAIRSVDPNHFITVGYNSIYSLLDCNEALDFTNVHVYDPPKSIQNIRNNMTTLDRMKLRWNDKPVMAGEFGMSSAYMMTDGKHLDPYTAAVGDMILYLYSYSKGYAGAINWQLNETPVSSMLKGMPWLASYTPDQQLAQERIGLYTYDNTYAGIAKPLAKSLSFFSEYLKSVGDEDSASFNLLTGGTRFGAGYELVSDNVVFAGTTKYTTDRLVFESSKAANVMVYKAGSKINMISTASCKVSINTTSFGIQAKNARVSGVKGEVSINGNFLVIELYEGEAVIIQ